MRSRVHVAAFLLAAGVIGCGAETPTAGEKGEVTGTVTANGKPVGNAWVAFRAMGGTAGPCRHKTGPDGTFKGTFTAGKYSWYLPTADGEAEGAVPREDLKKHLEAVKGVNEKYRQPTLDRLIDVSAGAKLDLKAD